MAISINFRKTGDWQAIQRQLDGLNVNIKHSLEYGQRKAADKLVKIVKDHLKNQDLNWDPLAISTQFKKKGDGRILIMTETYLDSIKTWQERGVRYIGVKRGITHPITGEEIAKIAQIHEFKSFQGGPQRALWGPSLEEIGGNKGIRLIITQVIYNKLKREGHNITYR